MGGKSGCDISRKSEEDGEGENGLIARDRPSDEPCWGKQDGFLSESLDFTIPKSKQTKTKN